MEMRRDSARILFRPRGEWGADSRLRTSLLTKEKGVFSPQAPARLVLALGAVAPARNQQTSYVDGGTPELRIPDKRPTNPTWS